jgi:hypothetical protein
MANFITPPHENDIVGGNEFTQIDPAIRQAVQRRIDIEELSARVIERGCLARGTQEICSECGRLGLKQTVCKTLSDTIGLNE